MKRWYVILCMLLSTLCSAVDIILWDLNKVLTYSIRKSGVDYTKRFVERALMPGMCDIVNELHELGYEQHIASNISATDFNQLLDEHKNPHLASLFSCICREKSMTCHMHQGKMLKKPARAYYQHYLRKNKLDPSETHIVFIDNLMANVQGAVSVGMTGVHFKTPAKLRNDLRNLGIPIELSK